MFYATWINTNSTRHHSSGKLGVYSACDRQVRHYLQRLIARGKIKTSEAHAPILSEIWNVAPLSFTFITLPSVIFFLDMFIEILF